MKSRFDLMKHFPLIIAGLIFISSCSTYDKVTCPDLSNNRSYSKKYLASNRVKKNIHKNHFAKRDQCNAFRIYNGPRNKTRNLKDNTIKQDLSFNPEISQIKTIPGITEFQISAIKDEKFDLIASSGNRAPNGSLVPNDPKIENNNNNGPAASAQNLSNFTKKEQQEIIKPFKKELKSAVRSHVQAISGQQAKPARGFAIGSIVCGLTVPLFIIVGSELITGLYGLLIFGSIIAGLLAIIFAWIALRRIRMNPELPGKGLAIAGLVIGLAPIIIIGILYLGLLLGGGGE